MEKYSAEFMENIANEILNGMYAVEGNNSMLHKLEPRLKSVDPETSTLYFTYKMDPETINGNNAMHGGFIATILDRCYAAAVYVGSPDNINITQEMHLQFHKAVYFKEEIEIRVQVVHVGGRTVSMNAQIFDGEDICVSSVVTFARTKKYR